MDACLAVEKEVERVITKFDNLHRNMDSGIDEQIAAIEKLQRDLVDENNGGSDISDAQRLMIKQLTNDVNKKVSKIATDHRDLHSSVSKVGKAIDRNFVADFDSTSREDVFSGPSKEHLLTEVILQHLCREGRLNISESLAKEAGVTEFQAQQEPFLEINRILEALKSNDLSPALDWVAKNREALNMWGTTQLFSTAPGGRHAVLQKSSLELRLHKLQFVELLKKGNNMDAIRYAKQNFPSFVCGQEREVQSLMGAVMYSGAALEKSPYAHLLSPTQWQETADLFLRDACALLGLSMESPLAVAVNAGCVALPALLNIKQVMQQRQVSAVWNAKDELPIEIELGGECRYHSVFACPILRQQVSDNNPPMKLVCGHVISRDALAKLAQGHKLKCPYCPLEQNPADARQIFF